MRRYVLSNKLNNKAYTLMEALLGIMLMGVLIFLCMNFMLVLNKSQMYDYSKEEMVVFIGQVQEDFLKSNEVLLDESELKLTSYDGEKISYLKDNSRLIRQVNDEGYEIMLNDIEDIKWDEVGNIINVSISFSNGYKYTGVIGDIK